MTKEATYDEAGAAEVIRTEGAPSGAAPQGEGGGGCHSGAEFEAAARAAGQSGLLDRYAEDYPQGPHDRPQSMCPAFGSLRVGLRMKRVATRGPDAVMTEQAVWLRDRDAIVRIGAVQNGRSPQDVHVFRFDAAGNLEEALRAGAASIRGDGRWLLLDVQRDILDGGDAGSPLGGSF